MGNYAAGGAVKRDLFNEDGGFVLDSALLDQLATAGLEQQAEEVRAEGWQWVDVRPDFSYDDYGNYGRRYPQQVELSDEDQAELDQLSSDYDNLAEMLNEGDGNEEDQHRFAQMEERIDELTAKRRAYEPETLDIAGAVVMLNHQGGIWVERGLVHPEIALVAVVHALLLPVLYTYSRSQSALQISLHMESIAGYMRDAESCKGLAEMETMRELFGEQLPGDAADLFGWLCDKTQDQLLELLAYAAAHAVNVVEKKHSDRRNGIAQGNELGRALNINMSDWFTTGADNYLSRISRQAIEAAVTEAKGEQKALAVKAASKKSEAVTIAERLLEGTHWIPAPLRITRAMTTVADEDETLDNQEYQFPEAAE